MTKEFVKVVLKSGKDQSLLRFHPWVFSGAIKKMYGTPAEGDLVKVYSNKDQFLGIGHFQVGSIAIRIVSFEEIEPDYDFWKSKIESAWNLRKKLGFENNAETNVFRLIHAEGDGMPGLVVDFYNGTAVMQMHSIGMYLIREELVKAMQEVMGDQLKAVYNKSEKTLPFKADVKSEDGYLFGSPETSGNEVLEYGLRFKVDWEKGQKTGFFVDQRENRKLVQDYSKDRDVLNMFCYTGGFSFYAMQGGAKSVHSVDASAKAIDLTDENVELNFPGDERHKSTVVDGFEYLKDIQDKYDLIILDPPAFAKHRKTLPQALKGYKRINTRAFEQIRKGGILFTFSCSQVVSKEKFREAVFSAAAIAGRKVRILHQMSQPVDHPVNIYHPEGEYLKGLVLYVE
ncbi:class I SAM-dependent rRNA methyltransferase [Draconibacterium halophilum]|uniref:Class I SAM-dependent rRNA methyltransferase n=1 Tax=Draconibacterium halophilum TaxID=2706887 RepID=A0A6C0RDX8_9BACT|nr:class I SAM-dependent rRNA methyltransferase [Draconibacterium halophilum]QIA08744.1 class I SAM-dependent rRNA methyltransferase [Draconibacterium halophilum]